MTVETAPPSNGNEAGLRGPGGWGMFLRGRVAVLSGMAALTIAVGLGYIVWHATHEPQLPGPLRARMVESKTEHDAIVQGLRRLEWRQDVQTCVTTLTVQQREQLRAQWSPGALRVWCPWVETP